MATKVTESSLSCSICLRRFKKPRILPCLHSYCEDCLVEYAPRGTERMLCPLCGVKVDIPDGDVTKFKLDFRLQSQVEEANQYDKESGITAEVLACNCCQEEAEALAKCRECGQILCKIGLKAHENLFGLKLHHVIPLGDEEINEEQENQPSDSAETTGDGYPIEKRAILVSNLPRLPHSPARIRDRLTIHFQKKSNNGGDVDGVIYPIDGCPQNAVVVFTERQAYDSVLRCEHFLTDFQTIISIQPLPQVFKDIEASVNDFYWNLIPRMDMKSLIDALSKMFGMDNINTSGHVLAKIACTADQLQSVHGAIVKAIGLKHSSGTGVSAIASGILVKNIPYLTNDLEQLRDELKKHMEIEGVSQVESLMCPIQGNVKEAIILFRSSQDRKGYIKYSDKCFFGEILDVIKLPPIFQELTASLEDFYGTHIKHYGLDAIQAKIHLSCRSSNIPSMSFTEAEVKGTSAQITAAASAILDVIGVSLENLVQSQLDSHGTTSTGTQTTRVDEDQIILGTPQTGHFQTDEGIAIVNSLGDIATQQTDVMISCTDERLNHKDGVSASISKAAGPELRREYKALIMKRRRNLKPGEMITTGGYKLQCSKVLHVIEPEIEALEEKLLEMILFAGRTLSAKTITLPLVGSAADGSQNGRCAQIAAFAVKRISRMGTPIEKIHFINAGAKETWALCNVLSATLVGASPGSCVDNTMSYFNMFKHDNRGLLKSYTSDTMRYQTNASEIWSSPKGTRSYQTPLGLVTSQSVDRQSNVLHQGAVPKGAHQQQTTMNTIQDTASAASDYISTRVNPTLSTFNPSSPAVAINPGSRSARYPVPPPGTSTVTFPLNTQPTISQSYASPVTTKWTSFSGQQGCCKCWAQTRCKRLEGCGHMFCTDCITRHIAPIAKCLTCSALYCVTHEKTLRGTMTYFIRADVNLSCHSEKGAIVIMYELPAGVSDVKEHRRRPYKGNSFTAYLPTNTDGYETVCLLRNAFIAGLIFAVKSSTGGHFEVNWSGMIPHKLNINGGIANNGYPDKGYIKRVTYALKKHGIVSSISSTAL